MPLRLPPFLDAQEIFSLVGFAVLSYFLFCLAHAKSSGLPLINSKRPLELSISKARLRYLKDAHGLIMSGLAKVHMACTESRHLNSHMILGRCFSSRYGKRHQNNTFRRLCGGYSKPPLLVIEWCFSN